MDPNKVRMSNLEKRINNQEQKLDKILKNYSMATTYLTLTNRVLRELNETELTSSTFASSRGIQTAVKDFVNKGIHDIYNETGEIPLLYSRTSQDLTVGDNEYDFPADFRKADMDSFVLKPTELVTNGEFDI